MTALSERGGSAAGRARVPVCRLADLVVERGCAALVDGEQVAIFRLTDDTVRVVQQRDPYSGANVMSRGIVGTREGVATVAAPMYKQVFALTTGRCLEDAGYQLRPGQAPDLATWEVDVVEGIVYVGARLPLASS